MTKDTYYDYLKEKSGDVKANMQKYVSQKPELDKLLERLIAPYLKGNMNVLDACCGNGHLIYHLSQLNKDARFTGVDYHDFVLEEAKKNNAGNPNVEFVSLDYHELARKYKKEFDISINWKTLSWLPNYEEIMKQLFAVTKKHIFVSSLFYDGDIDFEIKVRENKKVKNKELFVYYNIYSYPRFETFCYDSGAKKVEAHDFEIGIDLSPPPKDEMGTYTVKLDNGRRLQLSGAITMPWKVIRIEL